MSPENMKFFKEYYKKLNSSYDPEHTMPTVNYDCGSIVLWECMMLHSQCWPRNSRGGGRWSKIQANLGRKQAANTLKKWGHLLAAQLHKNTARATIRRLRLNHIRVLKCDPNIIENLWQDPPSNYTAVKTSVLTCSTTVEGFVKLHHFSLHRSIT